MSVPWETINEKLPFQRNKVDLIHVIRSKFVMYKNTVLWLVLASCLSTTKSLVYYKYTMDFLS